MKKTTIFVCAVVAVGAIYGMHKVMGTQNSVSDQIQTTNQQIVPSTSTQFNTGRAVPSGGAVDFTGAAEVVMPTVVHIATKTTIRTSVYQGFDIWRDFFGEDWNVPQKENVQKSSGSGVIVQNDGYIVTNNHVVNGADEITVTLHDKREFVAQVIGTDPNTDLALIKIEAEDLQPIQFANSDEVKVGEWVLAVGNPFNLNSTVTAGIVSAKGRNINILRQKYAIESFIQTDAAINPGNSGGALTNASGLLIGINTAIASPTGSYTGYGFAVPANIVSKVIYDLKTYGVVQRGFIGVTIADVNSKLAAEKNLKVNAGAYINSVAENGAAAKAGVEKGDVIVAIDDIAISSSTELQEIIGRRTPGDVIRVKVNRKGSEKNFNIHLTNKDGGEGIMSEQTVEVSTVLGISIKDANTKTLKKLGLESGVEVTQVNDGVVKKHTNMSKGFIITKVDNQAVKSAEQFEQIMRKKSGGVMIEGVYPDRAGVFYYAFGL